MLITTCWISSRRDEVSKDADVEFASLLLVQLFRLLYIYQGIHKDKTKGVLLYDDQNIPNLIVKGKNEKEVDKKRVFKKKEKQPQAIPS